MQGTRLFRIEELAALRGESYASTRAAIQRGEIAVVKVGSRGVRIPESEVARLIGRKDVNGEALSGLISDELLRSLRR